MERDGGGFVTGPELRACILKEDPGGLSGGAERAAYVPGLGEMRLELFCMK